MKSDPNSWFQSFYEMIQMFEYINIEVSKKQIRCLLQTLAVNMCYGILKADSHMDELCVVLNKDINCLTTIVQLVRSATEVVN